jgi:hypothetical protein
LHESGSFFVTHTLAVLFSGISRIPLAATQTTIPLAATQTSPAIAYLRNAQILCVVRTE